MGFSELSPTLVAALLSATAAAVLGLYFLRRRPKKVLVSNLEFWKAALARSKPRTLFYLRVPWVPFLLSALIALLIALLVAGPHFGRALTRTTILIVSADRSMATSDGGETRLSRARNEAISWMQGARRQGTFAVLRAGVRPRVMVPLTHDAEGGRVALEELQNDDGPADLGAAIALAKAILQSREGNGQILVFSDRPPPRHQGSTSDYPVTFMPVGGAADSFAITDFRARRNPAAAGEYVAEVEVASFCRTPGTVRVTIKDREITILDQRLDLAPNERSVLRATGFSSAFGELSARLSEALLATGHDAQPHDDVAFVTVPSLQPTRVLVVTDGSPYLSAALSVHPLVHANFVGSQVLQSDLQARLSGYDVVILDRVSPPSPIRHPGVLLFDSTGGGAVRALRRLPAPEVSATLSGHPAMGHVHLERVAVNQAAALYTEPEDQVLVRTEGDALALARSSRQGRLIAFGFSEHSSDLGQHAIFPLLLHHALLWLRGQDRSPLHPKRPGEALFANTTVLGPDGAGYEPRAGVVDSTTQAGLYRTASGTVAYSAAETSQPLPAPQPRAKRPGAESLPPLALLLGVLALLLLLLEWVLLQRGSIA